MSLKEFMNTQNIPNIPINIPTNVPTNVPNPLITNADIQVTQVYCPVLPISQMYQQEYNMKKSVERLAKCILKSAYKYTLQVAVNKLTPQNQFAIVYLGTIGSEYGNEYEWIEEALVDALHEYRHYPLNVKMVYLEEPCELFEESNIISKLDEKKYLFNL